MTEQEINKYVNANWINEMVKQIGLKHIVNYTIDNNDTEVALLLYTNYRKRLKGKKYYIIQSLATINVMTNGVIK